MHHWVQPLQTRTVWPHHPERPVLPVLQDIRLQEERYSQGRHWTRQGVPDGMCHQHLVSFGYLKIQKFKSRTNILLKKANPCVLVELQMPCKRHRILNSSGMAVVMDAPSRVDLDTSRTQTMVMPTPQLDKERLPDRSNAARMRSTCASTTVTSSQPTLPTFNWLLSDRVRSLSQARTQRRFATFTMIHETVVLRDWVPSDSNRYDVDHHVELWSIQVAFWWWMAGLTSLLMRESALLPLVVGYTIWWI